MRVDMAYFNRILPPAEIGHLLTYSLPHRRPDGSFVAHIDGGYEKALENLLPAIKAGFESQGISPLEEQFADDKYKTGVRAEGVRLMISITTANITGEAGGYEEASMRRRGRFGRMKTITVERQATRAYVQGILVDTREGGDIDSLASVLKENGYTVDEIDRSEFSIPKK